MRVGLLSSTAVINLLNKEFVCAWALPPEMSEVIDHSSNPLHKDVAKRMMSKYEPLVHVFVVDPQGRIVGDQKANADIFEGFENPSKATKELIDRFTNFLTKSMKAAQSNH